MKNVRFLIAGIEILASNVYIMPNKKEKNNLYTTSRNWSSQCSEYMNTSRISKLQKKAIRVISNCKYNAHTTPIFKSLNIMKINDIFLRLILKFCYQHHHQMLPSYFHNFNLVQGQDIHQHDTRFNRLLGLILNPTKNCTLIKE